MSEKIYGSLTELIGNTPLLDLKNFEQHRGVNARILAKLEYFNPLGSVKDRIGYAMITDAEKKGLLKPGGIFVLEHSKNNDFSTHPLFDQHRSYGSVNFSLFRTPI